MWADGPGPSGTPTRSYVSWVPGSGCSDHGFEDGRACSLQDGSVAEVSQVSARVVDSFLLSSHVVCHCMGHFIAQAAFDDAIFPPISFAPVLPILFLPCVLASTTNSYWLKHGHLGCEGTKDLEYEYSGMSRC